MKVSFSYPLSHIVGTKQKDRMPRYANIWYMKPWSDLSIYKSYIDIN